MRAFIAHQLILQQRMFSYEKKINFKIPSTQVNPHESVRNVLFVCLERVGDCYGYVWMAGQIVESR